MYLWPFSFFLFATRLGVWSHHSPRGQAQILGGRREDVPRPPEEEAGTATQTDIGRHAHHRGEAGRGKEGKNVNVRKAMESKGGNFEVSNGK